ncbi:redoxin domain-containing protein, partial [Candidatus Bipolaricaulota bacterium]|nr:redoxin domain-containing protein [Candidatus Bipolaricaulota bacterium]
MRSTILAAGLAILALAVSVSSETAITLPPFELPTLTGEEISDLDLQGTTLLLFMLPDSEACDAGLQLVQAALVETSGITTALVVPEASDAARDLVERESIAWPVIPDEVFLLASIFGIGSVPTVCLLRDGVLVGRLDRGFTAEDLPVAL